MDFSIPVEELKKQKLFVAVPMYGGQCAGMFARSLADLTATCTRYSIPLQFYFLFNESLVTRARNYCADEFMRSDCTHMMFIDSDIGFKAQDVVALLGLAVQNPEEMNILCGPYPKKTIAWEKIKAAVDRGAADENPNNLENYVGDYVFNPKQGGKIIIAEPCEVAEGGTGFMLIQRQVFEKYSETYPQFLYKPDHIRTENFDGSREIMAYFDALIDDKSQNLVPEITAFYEENPNATRDDVIEFLEDKRHGIVRENYSNRYLSEDYMFCYNVQRMGMKIWLCPWMELKHVGTYIFGGSLGHLASVGAAATADHKKLSKKKAIK